MAVWQEREDDLEAELNRGALWAVTYGDLMSYLVILFLILYAAASSKAMNMQMGLKGVEATFGKEKQVAEQILSDEGIKKIARLEVLEDKVRIVFSSPILFDSGAADLKPDFLPQMRKLAQALATLPNPIQVEGHSDNQPLGPRIPFKSNWELSAARAFSLLKFLEANGVRPSQLSAIGYGEYRPERPNDSPENMAKNRRIEITILKQKG